MHFSGKWRRIHCRRGKANSASLLGMFACYCATAVAHSDVGDGSLLAAHGSGSPWVEWDRDGPATSARVDC